MKSFEGVIVNDASIIIDDAVFIGGGTVIYAGTRLRGNTIIGAGCVLAGCEIFDSVIGNGCNICGNAVIRDSALGTDCEVDACTVIKRSKIGDGCCIGVCTVIDGSGIDSHTKIVQSNISHSHVGRGVTVGPFAVLRNDTKVSDGCRIGDFVEIKNSLLGEGVKAAHLAYIGDAEVGSETNVGCGTVFANYNGKAKNRTVVGENVFIGANTNLVAPLSIGGNAFIAAGSTITENIPENSFAIARQRQITKTDYFPRD